jgi:hypothetical protein
MRPAAARSSSMPAASDMWLEPESDSDEDAIHHAVGMWNFSQRRREAAGDAQADVSPAMEIYGHYDDLQQSIVMEQAIADVEATLQKKAEVHKPTHVSRMVLGQTLEAMALHSQLCMIVRTVAEGARGDVLELSRVSLARKARVSAVRAYVPALEATAGGAPAPSVGCTADRELGHAERNRRHMGALGASMSQTHQHPLFCPWLLRAVHIACTHKIATLVSRDVHNGRCPARTRSGWCSGTGKWAEWRPAALADALRSSRCARGASRTIWTLCSLHVRALRCLLSLSANVRSSLGSQRSV